MFRFLNNITPVVKNLLIINVLFFIAQLLLPRVGIDVDSLALRHPYSEHFRPWQLATHFFMHSTSFIPHILFNMYALVLFGTPLEKVWGGKRFLIYYLVTALGAAILYLLYNTYELNQLYSFIENFTANPTLTDFQYFRSNYLPDSKHLTKEAREVIFAISEGWATNFNEASSAAVNLMELVSKEQANTKMVGASGAVFGVLLAFGMLFPNTELMLMFIPIPIKAKYFVMIYGALELYLGISRFEGDNVAHFAHLGGMLFGFVLIKIWQKHTQ